MFLHPAFCGHLLGEALHQEQLQAAHVQYVKWLSKILPDKESSRCGRVSEFKCYMRRAGLDKLHDILKDKPMKLSLRAWNKSLVQFYIPNIYIACIYESANGQWMAVKGIVKNVKNIKMDKNREV